MLPTTAPLIATMSGDTVQPQTADVRARSPASEKTGGVSAVRLMTPADGRPPVSVGDRRNRRPEDDAEDEGRI